MIKTNTQSPSAFGPFLELFNGEAYKPHPGDAALPLGRRFEGRELVVIGGCGTGLGWTQRVRFDAQGAHHLLGERSPSQKRGSPEWVEHLTREARATSGWTVLVFEQQWQATVSAMSAASIGAHGVEQMLRVRDAVRNFGDDRIAEDAIRAVVDHPTMEGGIVVGVRLSLLETIE